MDNTVCFVLKNDLGGITSLTKNLIQFRGHDALPQEVVFLDIEGNKYAPYFGDFVNDIPTTVFRYSTKNNLYHSFKKLRDVVGKHPGVLVSNDMFDLIMLTHYNIPKKVVQIVHDAYNVKLSLQFHNVIDRFICHSLFYFEMLCQLLPDRRDDVIFIPYGIPLTSQERQLNQNECLKLLFLGRHDKMKGVYDLYEIDALLKRWDVPVSWLILGKGPETESLMKQWSKAENVTFYIAKDNDEIQKVCLTQDVLVFPTKFEGFPVAMVEAMSAGCVPVVSDLPGGTRELAKDERGILCTLNDNYLFAKAIKNFHENRGLLKEMSDKCSDFIRCTHNAVIQSPKYQSFFKNVASESIIPRHHRIKMKLGSRLDKKWIPNIVTTYLRKI